MLLPTPVDRSALRALALALLAVVALSVVAATIDSTVVSSGGPVGFGGGETGGAVAGDTDETGTQPSGDSSGSLSIPTPCFPWLLSPGVLAVVALVFVLLGAYAYRETGSLLPPLAIFAAVGPPVVLLFALLTGCRREFSFSSRAAAAARNVSFLPAGDGGSLGQGGNAAQSVSPPTVLFGLLLAVALAVAAFMLVTGTGDSPAADDEVTPADEDEGSNVAAVGRAAGAAAQRIEDGDADVENEVFRAWGEMTALLDVPNRRAATPAEFAHSAVDAGMDRDDVDDLTTLFEEVRYGGFEATPERERRAVDALRSIERAYADSPEGDR